MEARMAKDWREYPHIVALVSELRAWKDEFRIVEYIRANESGYDETERIQGASDKSSFEVASEYCWTHFTSDGEWIQSGVRAGDWGTGGVYGWFVGEIQSGSQHITLQTHAFACSVCEGLYAYTGENGQDLDCEACLEQDADFIDLFEVLNLESSS